MGSMNNWLAFSLSPQELPQAQAHDNHPSPAAVSRLISGGDVPADCYGLSGHSSAAALGIPGGPFAVLEAFSRQQQQQSQEQVTDWNSLKSLDYKGGSSELSMLVGSGSNQMSMDTDEPKLEDFLGGNSFSDDGQKLPTGCNSMTGTYDGAADYMFSGCSLQLPSTAATLSASDGGGGAAGGATLDGGANNGGCSSSIGLSMIKTWLRSQPAPSSHLESRGGDPAMDGSGCRATPSLTAGNRVPAAASNALSLSMSTGSQSSSTLPLMAVNGGGGGETSSSGDNKQKDGGAIALEAQNGAIDAVPRKSIDTFGQRTSIYRGVTRHRWTGRYEAHLWDNSCRREGQTRKGRQVYLGGYDKEEKAARAYDLAALKYWGTTTTTNFPISNYEKELEEMKHMTRQEFVASLRRKSSGFSRGASIYRGVTRHHQHGRWQARIGRVAGNKDLYLGTFSTQEEAAEAYDIAAIKFRGLNAVTNFDMSRYDVKSIMESATLPIGGASKRLGEASSSHSEASVDGRRSDGGDSITSHLAVGVGGYMAAHHHGWPGLAFPQAASQPLAVQYPYVQQRGWCKQEQDHGGVALQDLHQLHLSGGGGGGPQNFFQPSALHGLVGLDSSSMELSSGSGSVVYGGGGSGGGGVYPGVVAGNSGFAVPFGTVVAEPSHGGGGYGETEVKQLGYEGLLAPADPYSGRNVYYLPQQSSSGVIKPNGYEQNPNCTSWTAGSVQNLHGGGPTFSVWNES